MGAEAAGTPGKVPALAMRRVGAPELLFVDDPGLPSADEVRVAVELVPISIAEVRATRGDRFRHFGQTLDPDVPFVFGFTGVGRVVASRSDRIAEGVRVVLSGLASCGRCRFCSIRQENHCTNLKLAGIDVGSPGYARAFVVVPGRRVFPIDDDFPGVHACVVSEVATAIHCLQRGRLRRGEALGVVGGGRHGRQIVRVAKRLGARVVVVDPDERARQLSMAAGADEAIDARSVNQDWLARYGLDVVVHANSFEASLATCCDIAAHGGRVVLLGTPAGLDVRLEAFGRRVVDAQRELIGSDSKNPESFVAAIELMGQGNDDWDIRKPRFVHLAESANVLAQAAANWPSPDDLFVAIGRGGDMQPGVA